MSESSSHIKAKNKAAGKNGHTEVPLSGNRRLDALSAGGHRATEVERSGNPTLLEKAAKRLKDSGAKQKVLQVPHNDLKLASNAMRTVGVSGTIKNLGGTTRRAVKLK